MADPAPARHLSAVPTRPRRRIEPLWRHLLGEQLRRLRHERGETLGQTAARAGISPQYLSEVERGLKEPSSEMIAAVAHALDATLIDLTLAVAADLAAVSELTVVTGLSTAAGADRVRSAGGPAVMLAA
jgi:transcriptional regulator with XRE-family HTH domain